MTVLFVNAVSKTWLVVKINQFFNCRTKTAFLEVIITIDKFMKENNMHAAIKSRIMAFYELQWQYNSVMILEQGN